MKKMLINATSSDEWRVAVVDGHSLLDLDIEFRNQAQITANIYKACVTRIEPSLEAAFVNYGGNRHGFLPIKAIARHYYPSKKEDSETTIKDLLHEGQELIVQVEKEERNNKGAALTTLITLAGCYLVLMPNSANNSGISRRIEGKEREQLREILEQLNVPDNMSVIIRTAGLGKTIEELQWDLDILVNTWKAIKVSGAKSQKAPFLIHQESDAILRAIRDYLRADIAEIIIDNPQDFDRLRQYLECVRPEYVDKIKLHQQPVPLFSYCRIEQQVETIFQREVQLPSGGSIIIDQTEALIAIDINSARSTKGTDIEETALTTNLEATQEIARQLRLRDLGGLIIIDFIDMISIHNRRSVENSLREALHRGRARFRIGSISRLFGLLQMSRQRLRSSLCEPQQTICPRCHGQGNIRSLTALATSLIRILEEKATQENTAQIRVQAPMLLASYLFNEKRQIITGIEKRHNITIFIIANPYLDIPDYEFEVITICQYASNNQKQLSYEMIKKPSVALDDITQQKTNYKIKPEQPALKVQLPTKPAPMTKTQGHQKTSWLQQLINYLLGRGKKQSKPLQRTKSNPKRRSANQSSRRGNPNSRQRFHHNNRNNNQEKPHGRYYANKSRPRKKRPNDKPIGDHSTQRQATTRRFKPTVSASNDITAPTTTQQQKPSMPQKADKQVILPAKNSSFMEAKSELMQIETTQKLMNKENKADANK